MYAYLHNLITCSKSDIAICPVFGKPDLLRTTEPLVMSPLKAFCYLYNQSYVHNKLFKAHLLKDILFQTDIAICEDLVFCFQVFRRATQIIYGPNPKYHYVTYPNSSSHSRCFSLKKLSVFKATEFIKTHASRTEWEILHKKIFQMEAYMATGLLGFIVRDQLVMPDTVSYLRKILLKNLIIHLLSSHKLTNKFFAVACCINFNLTAKLYCVYLRGKIWLKK